MMIHRTETMAPHEMYSCASRVISFLTQRDDLEITHQVMQMRRCNYKWKESRIRKSTDFIYDVEIRFLLRHLLRNTRLVVPQCKTTVQQVSNKLKAGECALVMVNLHIMIVHNGCIYDVLNFGTPVALCRQWRSAKVHWYQRVKQ
jgi:hypothetical protein